MTSNDVIELGGEFRSDGKKIEKAIEIMAERGTHEAIPRIEEQANKAARAIQAAMDLVVEVGASLTGPGPLFGAAGKTITTAAEVFDQAAKRPAKAGKLPPEDGR